MIYQQSGTTLQSIIYKMSEALSRNDFRRKEGWITKIYKFLMMMILAEFVLEETINVQRRSFTSWDDYKYVKIVKLTKLIFLIVALTQSALTLLYLMWSKYNYEFQYQKNTIIAFLVTELAGLLMFAYIQIMNNN